MEIMSGLTQSVIDNLVKSVNEWLDWFEIDPSLALPVLTQ